MAHLVIGTDEFRLVERKGMHPILILHLSDLNGTMVILITTSNKECPFKLLHIFKFITQLFGCHNLSTYGQHSVNIS
jgi:hypothetical protein